MSDLERVAHELVASLTEATRIAEALRVATRRADACATVAARGAREAPGLGRVAATFDRAARQCDNAAERLDEAYRKGRSWAAQVVAGASSAGSGGDADADAGSRSGGGSNAGAGSASSGGADGSSSFDRERARLAARGIADDVIAEQLHHWIRETQHRSSDWDIAEQEQPPELTDVEQDQVREFLAGRTDAERSITHDLREITSGRPGGLVGLKYSLKGEGRITEKVREDVAIGVAADRAVRQVADTIRYTQQIPDGVYAAEVDRTVNALTDRGYDLVKWKNLWDGQTYRGINSQWRDRRSGYLFELQFHTPTSFYVKDELTHGLYARERDARTTRRERWTISAILSKITGQIPVPSDGAALRFEPREGRHG